MKIKKILIGALAFITAFAATVSPIAENLPQMTDAGALSASADVYGDFTYQAYESGSQKGVQITAYSGTKAGVKVPEKINGKSVLSIGIGVFEFCSSLKTISIPASVIDFGGYESWGSPFVGCTSLTSITVASGNKYFTSVNGILFDKKKTTLICYPAAKTAKTYSIPSGVTTICGDAFYRCASLTKITLPKGVKNIGYNAFYSCTALKTLNIPAGVTDIGSYAFENCSSLETLSFPASVNELRSGCFLGCKSMKSITVASANKNHTTVNGVLFNKKKTELIYYPAAKTAKSYSIPSGVETIGNYSFDNCSIITSVTLPKTVKTISYGAFYGCTALKKVNIPDSVLSVGSSAFYNTAIVKNQKTQLKYIGNWLVGTDRDIKTAKIKSGIKNIADNVFDYTALSEVIFPDSLEYIGYHAFGYCDSLTSVTLPKNLTVMDGSTFSGCKSLKSVYMYNKVKRIGMFAFDNCDSLKGINYAGTKKQWNAVEKVASSDNLSKLTIRYNSVILSVSGQSDTSVSLSWTKSAGAAGYKIERYTGGKWKVIKSLKGESKTTYKATGLSAGTDNKFRVRAYKTSNGKTTYGAYSQIITAGTNPSQVKNLSSSARTKTSITLKWTKNTSGKGYQVQQYKSGNWVTVKTITKNSTVSYKVTGLKAGTTYKFRVRAYKDDYYGAYSTTLTTSTSK